MDRVLICTVGGSLAPIRSAVRARRTKHLLLLATAEGGPDRQGSRAEAQALADELKSAAGIAEVAILPADDPDAAGVLCRDHVARLRRQYPRAEIVCDYTGGTKSMSAALMLACIADPEARVTLQLMRGERHNLDRVTDGTERPVRIEVDALLADRLLERADRAWRNFGYAEAALLLADARDNLEHAEAVPASLRTRLVTAHAASLAFAAWDRFDHAAALAAWSAIPGPARQRLAPFEKGLRSLTGASQDRVPLALLDLWNNALRRAARGQHDDAVARCYRAVEWSAQWVLKTQKGIDTARVSRSEIGPVLFDKFARGVIRSTTLKIGLDQALECVRTLLPQHPLTQALGRKGQRSDALTDLTAWKEMRNHSILAHGFEPIGAAGWATVEAWMTRNWLPWLTAEATDRSLSLPQLPQRLQDHG
ncbi:MAG: hypothetical protein U1E45_16445 [Geminicoccaceae bacterium]